MRKQGHLFLSWCPWSPDSTPPPKNWDISVFCCSQTFYRCWLFHSPKIDTTVGYHTCSQASLPVPCKEGTHPWRMPHVFMLCIPAPLLFISCGILRLLMLLCFTGIVVSSNSDMGPSLLLQAQASSPDSAPLHAAPPGKATRQVLWLVLQVPMLTLWASGLSQGAYEDYLSLRDFTIQRSSC